MGIVAGFKRVANSIRSSAAVDPIERIRRTGFFRPDDIQLVHDTYFSGVGPAPGGPWDVFRDAHMELPAWFEPGLDPYSSEYARQQHRLWRLVAGVDRDYEVEVDEKEADWGEVDAVRRPGYYVRRDPGAVSAASDHVIATGMMLKHCGLKPGDWALEYGAGFAQTALALARLGVNVDTVDVSDRFCGWVREQAEFFRVPLSPFKGRFGDAPRMEQKYQVVWFYESFHHCLDFATVVRELPKLLAPGGRVILSGEPIVEREYAAVPYPWGLRLHSEVVAVVRRQRWFELGFSEDFLFELFAHAGFTMQRIECEPSMFGRMYVCHHRPAQVSLGRQWMPQRIAEGWRPTVGATDRQVTGEADWPIEQRDEAREIEVRLRTLCNAPQSVVASCGGNEIALVVPPDQPLDVRLAIPPGATSLRIKCTDAGARSLLRRIGWSGGSGGIAVESIREIPGQ